MSASHLGPLLSSSDRKVVRLAKVESTPALPSRMRDPALILRSFERSDSRRSRIAKTPNRSRERLPRVFVATEDGVQVIKRTVTLDEMLPRSTPRHKSSGFWQHSEKELAVFSPQPACGEDVEATLVGPAPLSFQPSTDTQESDGAMRQSTPRASSPRGSTFGGGGDVRPRSRLMRRHHVMDGMFLAPLSTESRIPTVMRRSGVAGHFADLTLGEANRAVMQQFSEKEGHTSHSPDRGGSSRGQQADAHAEVAHLLAAMQSARACSRGLASDARLLAAFRALARAAQLPAAMAADALPAIVAELRASLFVQPEDARPLEAAREPDWAGWVRRSAVPETYLAHAYQTEDRISELERTIRQLQAEKQAAVQEADGLRKELTQRRKDAGRTPRAADSLFTSGSTFAFDDPDDPSDPDNAMVIRDHFDSVPTEQQVPILLTLVQRMPLTQQGELACRALDSMGPITARKAVLSWLQAHPCDVPFIQSVVVQSFARMDDDESAALLEELLTERTSRGLPVLDIMRGVAGADDMRAILDALARDGSLSVDVLAEFVGKLPPFRRSNAVRFLIQRHGSDVLDRLMIDSVSDAPSMQLFLGRVFVGRSSDLITATLQTAASMLPAQAAITGLEGVAIASIGCAIANAVAEGSHELSAYLDRVLRVFSPEVQNLVRKKLSAQAVRRAKEADLARQKERRALLEKEVAETWNPGAVMARVNMLIAGKADQDREDITNGRRPPHLVEFAQDQFIGEFALRSVAAVHYDLFREALQRFEDLHPRVRLCGAMMGLGIDPHDVHLLPRMGATVLHVMRVAVHAHVRAELDKASMPGDVIWIPLTLARDALLSAFPTKRPTYSVDSLYLQPAHRSVMLNDLDQLTVVLGGAGLEQEPSAPSMMSVPLDSLLHLALRTFMGQAHADRQSLKELFDSFDEDGNGVLDLQEFTKIVDHCIPSGVDQREIVAWFKSLGELSKALSGGTADSARDGVDDDGQGQDREGGSEDAVTPEVFARMCEIKGITPPETEVA